MGTSQFPPTSGGVDPITDRNLSGYQALLMGFVNTARVLLLVGFSLALVACSGSAAESDDRARQEQIRRDAPGVFDEGTASDRDRARVFTDPGEPDEVPMTRTLSIDGSDPRLSPGRDPIAPEQRPRPSAGASTEGNPSGWLRS